MAETTTSTVVIHPARNLQGSIRLPGDKSISHRYAMLAAIATGRSQFTNFSTGADCASTLSCVEAVGCNVQRGVGKVSVEGRGLELAPPKRPLDCGNSGSTMRMFSGILAGQNFETELIGDESLSRRPMQRIIGPLTEMGARIESHNGCAPLRIRGGHLHAVDYKMPVASAQVKSALLLAGLYANGTTYVEEPLRTRDHTEVALRAFGAEVITSGNRGGIRSGQQLRAIEADVPGDMSSAAFFLCAAALFPESNLVIEDVLMNPTRAVLLDVLGSMGVRVAVLKLEDQHGEPVGTIHVQPGALRGAHIHGAHSAALIDELPVLAAIAPYSVNGVEIRDARELRVKESDRIAAVARNLRAMGAVVEVFEDGLRVPGEQQLHGTDIDSVGDHRIAMAFAVAALRAKGETRIHGADSARISFPEFFDRLQQLTSE